jgi:hypothetical protein
MEVMLSSSIWHKAWSEAHGAKNRRTTVPHKRDWDEGRKYKTWDVHSLRQNSGGQALRSLRRGTMDEKSNTWSGRSQAIGYRLQEINDSEFSTLSLEPSATAPEPPLREDRNRH